MSEQDDDEREARVLALAAWLQNQGIPLNDGVDILVQVAARTVAGMAQNEVMLADAIGAVVRNFVGTAIQGFIQAAVRGQ